MSDMSALERALGLNESVGSTGEITPSDDVFRWATVITNEPLTIQFDGDPAPSKVTPSNVAGGLVEGDRVWVQMYGRRVIVLGSAGGQTAASFSSVNNQRAMVPFRNAVAAGTARLLAVGDSKTEGTSVTPTTRWLNVLTGLLRTKSGLTANTGFGYMPARYANFGWMTGGPTIAGVEGTDWVFFTFDGGLGYRAVQILTDAGQVTWPAQTCRYITVHYTKKNFFPGILEVRVDGVLQASINTTSSLSSEEGVQVIDMGSVASRVVNIRRQPGVNAPVIEGVSFDTALTGISVRDASRSGGWAGYFANGDVGGDAQVALHMSAIALVNPHLIIVALGANDMDNKPVAQWVTDLSRLFDLLTAAAPNAGILLLHGAMRIEDARSATAADYPGKLALFEAGARVAAGNRHNVSVRFESSLWQPINAPSNQDPFGFLADTVHPSTTGHARIAQHLAAEILPA